MDTIIVLETLDSEIEEIRTKIVDKIDEDYGVGVVEAVDIMSDCEEYQTAIKSIQAHAPYSEQAKKGMLAVISLLETARMTFAVPYADVTQHISNKILA